MSFHVLRGRDLRYPLDRRLGESIAEENIYAALGVRTYISQLFNPQLEQCGQSDQPTEKLSKGIALHRLLPRLAIASRETHRQADTEGL